MNKRPCALPPLRHTGLPIVNRLCVRVGLNPKGPSVKTAVEMKWIKTMNRDPISPQQEHDTQIHGAGRKSINANGVLDAPRWLQDTRNFIL